MLDLRGRRGGKAEGVNKIIDKRGLARAEGWTENDYSHRLGLRQRLDEWDIFYLQLYSCAKLSKMVAAPLAFSRMFTKSCPEKFCEHAGSATKEPRVGIQRSGLRPWIGAVRSFRPVSRYKIFDAVRA